MVVLSAALLTRNGKVLVARQFVEITRIRIEGLLTAFPKLLSSGQREHTFIDTESVRYVYQPLENYFVLIITNKTSNIVEDLHTIQSMAKLIPDICGSLNESAVKEKQFELVFGFDELISAGGHSENVSLQQIRINMEMESHEEKLHNMILESKRAAAKDDMKRHTIRIKEEQRERARLEKAGLSTGFANQLSFASSITSSFGRNSPRSASNMYENSSISSPTYSSGRSNDYEKSSASKASGMKLGGTGSAGGKSFMDAMVAEDDLKDIAPMSVSLNTAAKPVPQVAAVSHDPINIVLEDKVKVVMSREGKLLSMEVKSNLFLSVNDPASGRCRLKIRSKPSDAIGFQTHPKVDKKLFDQESIIGLKDATKSFPSNRVGVLRWSLKTSDDAYMPLSISCWPEEGSNGKMNVIIEYSMERAGMTLENVEIGIPLGTSDVPQITSIDGHHQHDLATRRLFWHLHRIDSSNSNGTLEFTVKGDNVDEFLPISVSFSSQNVYSDVEVEAVFDAQDSSAAIKYGFEKLLTTDSYEIIP